MEFDIKCVHGIKFDGIDHNDYPDYCDAYVCSGYYNGDEMTDEQLEYLNENYKEWVYDQLMDYLF